MSKHFDGDATDTQSGRIRIRRVGKGKPCLNPLTIYQVRRDRRQIDPLAIDPVTRQPMPDLHSDAWAVIMVPAPDSVDMFDAYHYRQDGHVAFLDGPDGDQVLVMPFGPEEFYVQLVTHRAPPPLVPSEPEPSP